MLKIQTVLEKVFGVEALLVTMTGTSNSVAD